MTDTQSSAKLIAPSFIQPVAVYSAREVTATTGLSARAPMSDQRAALSCTCDVTGRFL